MKTIEGNWGYLAPRFGFQLMVNRGGYFDQRYSITMCFVSFSDEVGEKSGSWKGGTVGCGFEINPNESMIDALRRMESTREF